jgi:hypothetical protein
MGPIWRAYPLETRRSRAIWGSINERVSSQLPNVYFRVGDLLSYYAHFLMQCVDVRRNDMIVSWQKSFQEDDRIPRSQAQDVLALSAFSLSSIPAPSSRKALVKAMWESGAHTIVHISDDISQSGQFTDVPT